MLDSPPSSRFPGLHCGRARVRGRTALCCWTCRSFLAQIRGVRSGRLGQAQRSARRRAAGERLGGLVDLVVELALGRRWSGCACSTSPPPRRSRISPRVPLPGKRQISGKSLCPTGAWRNWMWSIGSSRTRKRSKGISSTPTPTLVCATRKLTT